VARHLILDTAALIAVERGLTDISSLRDEDDLAIAAVTAAELRVGIEMADSPDRARRRHQALARFTATASVLDYAGRTAATHARLLAHVRRSGRARGVHDLIIAAQAAEHERVLVSPDLRARFGELPGVQALAL
jgi:predicted nucleic acid-binding protein